MVIAWDDSDGWYDHVVPTMVNPSDHPATTRSGPGDVGGHAGRRLPRPLRPRPSPAVAGGLAVRQGNFVDHTVTDQSSILRLIEDNWLGGERTGTASFDNIASTITDMFKFSQPNDSTLLLNPKTGEALR